MVSYLDYSLDNSRNEGGEIVKGSAILNSIKTTSKGTTITLSEVEMNANQLMKLQYLVGATVDISFGTIQNIVEESQLNLFEEKS